MWEHCAWHTWPAMYHTIKETASFFNKKRWLCWLCNNIYQKSCIIFYFSNGMYAGAYMIRFMSVEVENALHLAFGAFLFVCLFFWTNFWDEIILNKDLDWKLSLRHDQELCLWTTQFLTVVGTYVMGFPLAQEYSCFVVYTCVHVGCWWTRDERVRLKTIPIFWLSMNFPLDHIKLLVGPCSTSSLLLTIQNSSPLEGTAKLFFIQLSDCFF